MCRAPSLTGTTTVTAGGVDTVMTVGSTDGDRPDVTVVLATYRRPERLALTLEGLARIRSPRFRLIVVDNDVPRSAQPVVERFSSRFDDVTYLVEARTGATYARNRAVAAVRTPLTAIIDDDVVPADDWLARLTAPIRERRADVTGGRVILDPSVPRPRWFDEEVVGRYLTNFDLGDTERPITRTEYLVTANLALRTELFREVGGFDTSLGPRGRTQLVSDDVGLIRDVRAAGARALWVPDAVVVHELPPSRLRMSWLLRRAFLQGRSDWIVDRDRLARRRLNGARIAISWLRAQLAIRMREGLASPEVAFHAVCDAARTVGALREALSWMGER